MRVVPIRAGQSAQALIRFFQTESGPPNAEGSPLKSSVAWRRLMTQGILPGLEPYVEGRPQASDTEAGGARALATALAVLSVGVSTFIEWFEADAAKLQGAA